MKNFIAICILLFGTLTIYAQEKSPSLIGLELVMKDKVGAPFKIVYTHIVKQELIDPTGVTLAAVIQTRDGLLEALTKAPSQLLNFSGALKNPEAVEIFKEYQLGIRALILEMSKLIEIINAKLDDPEKLEAAKRQVQLIVHFQKKAHDQFKDE